MVDRDTSRGGTGFTKSIEERLDEQKSRVEKSRVDNSRRNPDNSRHSNGTDININIESSEVDIDVDVDNPKECEKVVQKLEKRFDKTDKPEEKMGILDKLMEGFKKAQMKVEKALTDGEKNNFKQIASRFKQSLQEKLEEFKERFGK